MSLIEWTGKTWNPLGGCKVVSPGCTNCYAMREAARLQRFPKAAHYKGLTDVVNGKPVWNGAAVKAPSATLLKPLKRKKPTTYFVNSMSDLFFEGFPDAWIDEVFAVMALCPQHTFQVLTKRPERMRGYMSTPGVGARIAAAAVGVAAHYADDDASFTTAMRRLADACLWGPRDDRGQPAGLAHWPLPNVWLGVSTEDQTRADQRIPVLLATPAAVRFISAEPLLGPIDVTPYLFVYTHADYAALERPDGGGRVLSLHDPATTPAAEVATPRLDWVIPGGESGDGARRCDVAHIRALVAQCAAAEVACFVKQLGKRPVVGAAAGDPLRLELSHRRGGDPDEWPADLRVRQTPPLAHEGRAVS